MDGTRHYGRYEVVGTLGKGAMGVVYLAEDRVIGRRVALKTIHTEPDLSAADLERLRARFAVEARSAGGLSHPYIVTVFDVGQEEDDVYIAMEYVEGESLHEILAAGRELSFQEISNLVARTASALDYAHRQGVVHRDVKPGNILVDRGGRPRITDFGIAKMATSTMTRTGAVLGTPAYMAPEQVEGTEVSGASDQFSLAVILFQMFTASLPFAAERPTRVMYKIVNEPPPPPRSLNDELPEDVDEVLLRALAKDPADRYPSCLDLAEAVRRTVGADPVQDLFEDLLEAGEAGEAGAGPDASALEATVLPSEREEAEEDQAEDRDRLDPTVLESSESDAAPPSQPPSDAASSSPPSGRERSFPQGESEAPPPEAERAPGREARIPEEPAPPEPEVAASDPDAAAGEADAAVPGAGAAAPGPDVADAAPQDRPEPEVQAAPPEERPRRRDAGRRRVRPYASSRGTARQRSGDWWMTQSPDDVRRAHRWRTAGRMLMWLAVVGAVGAAVWMVGPEELLARAEALLDRALSYAEAAREWAVGVLRRTVG